MSRRRAVRVESDADVGAAARAAREEAERCGLSAVEAQHVATAVSEVARNAVKYARGGVVELAPVERSGRRGLAVTVRDAGPGIADIAAALRDGMSTGGSLGYGLPGARRSRRRRGRAAVPQRAAAGPRGGGARGRGRARLAHARVACAGPAR